MVKFKYLKLILIIFLLFSSLTLVYIFRSNLVVGLNKVGILGWLRSTKLVKPNLPGYFSAVDNQNLIYDYDNNGVVDNADYLLILEAQGLESVSVSSLSLPKPEESTSSDKNVLGATTPVEASAGNIIQSSLSGYSTDTYSGSVAADYGFDLPPGSAGMMPSLKLTYSSGNVDDMYTGTETKWRNSLEHPYQQQAGLFGLGWNMGGLGTISRDVSRTLNNPVDDVFNISFEGGYARFSKESGNDSYSLWRTVPNIKIKAERYGLCKTQNSKNICRYHWVVTSPDGTKYTFGIPPTTNWQTVNDPDNSYFAQGVGKDWYPLMQLNSSGGVTAGVPWQIYGNDLDGWHALQYSWPLTKMESIYHLDGVRDAKISYQYAFDLGVYKGKKYVRAIYPSKVNYGKNRIDFIPESRLDYLIHVGEYGIGEAGQPMYASRRIRLINIYTLNKLRNSYLLEYKYGWDPYKHTGSDCPLPPTHLTQIKNGQVIHSLLSKVTPWDGNGAPTPTPLPPPPTYTTTCTVTEECKQASNCSGGSTGDACGTDIYGRTKYLCRVNTCIITCTP